MTPDLLSALRETPGCDAEVPGLYGFDDNGAQYQRRHSHRGALRYAETCDPCLTRLAEAVLTHYGPRIMELARDQVVLTYPDWPSLLSALRSETPR